MKIVSVNVKWQWKTLNKLPEGHRFIMVAKFSEDHISPKSAWSVVLEFTISPKKTRYLSKSHSSLEVLVSKW